MCKMIVHLVFNCLFLEIINTVGFIYAVPHILHPTVKHTHIIKHLRIYQELLGSALLCYLHAFIAVFSGKSRLSAVYLTYSEHSVVFEGISDIRMLIIKVFESVTHNESCCIVLVICGSCCIKNIELHQHFCIKGNLITNKSVVYYLKIIHSLLCCKRKYHVIDLDKIILEIMHHRLKAFNNIDICLGILHIPVKHEIAVLNLMNKL